MTVLAIFLGLTVAADPADRLDIVPGGLGIGPLLLRGIKRRIVAATLLGEHAPCIFLAVIGAEAFAGPAILPLGPATPVLRGCARRHAHAQQRGTCQQNGSISTGETWVFHL
jgi:hypothetical protein